MTDEARLTLASKELGIHMRVARDVFEPSRGRVPMLAVRAIQKRLIFVVHLKGAADTEDLALLDWTTHWPHNAGAMPHHSAKDGH